MSYVLIAGAKSDIARAAARLYADNGYDIYLAARNVSDLDAFSKDIKVRNQVDVKQLELDVLDYDSLEDFYNSLPEKPQGVISAVGYLGNQEKSQTDLKETRTIIDTNFTGIVCLFNIIAHDFEERKSGFIIGISSVAGDRGRKSNYTYGSAKAGFTAYLSGLRNRLDRAGVQVLTVKPGFVYTKMTAGLDLPGLLTARPEQVARDIYRAQLRKRGVVYSKGVWRVIMWVIRMIPEFMFKRMSL